MNPITKIFKTWSVTGRIALLVLLGFVFLALLAPLASPYSPCAATGPALAPPDWAHPLGTDELGVDLWAQIAHGSRVSLLVGLATAFLAAALGTLAGTVTALNGGWIDRVLMRVIDIKLAMADLPLLIVIAAFFGPGIWTIVTALALFSWTIPARIVRSRSLTLCQQTYIRAAESYGAGVLYRLRRHLIPELLPVIGVVMIRIAAKAVVAEAGLSLLGLGDPTAGSWGMIIHHATQFEGIYYTPFWKWWLLFPWLALTLFVSSLALISRECEAVQDGSRKP